MESEVLSLGIGGLIGLGLVALTTGVGRRESSNQKEEEGVIVPLHKLLDPGGHPWDVHTVGVPCSIGGHKVIGLLDSGSSEAAIPATIADRIHYNTFPPAPLHPGDPPVAAAANKHPDRYLPLSIAGLPTKTVRFLAAPAIGRAVGLTFPLINPVKIFTGEYDVEFAPFSRYVAFKPKSFTPPMIPYIPDPNPHIRLRPWQYTPYVNVILPISSSTITAPAHSQPIPMQIDTGSTTSTVTTPVAIQMGITNYPRARMRSICQGDDKEPGHRVPIMIPNVGIVVEMDVYTGDQERTNILSAQQLLELGYRIVFKDSGLDIYHR